MKLSKNKIIKLKKKKHQSYKNNNKNHKNKNNNKNHKNKNNNKNHKKTYTKKGKKNFNVRYNTIKNRKKKKRGGADSISTKPSIFANLDLTEIKSVTKGSYSNLIKINYDINDDTRRQILDEPEKIFFDIDNGFIYVSESYTDKSKPYDYGAYVQRLLSRFRLSIFIFFLNPQIMMLFRPITINVTSIHRINRAFHTNRANINVCDYHGYKSHRNYTMP